MVRYHDELFFVCLWMIAASFWGSLGGWCAPLAAQTVQFSPLLERDVPILTAREHPWARYLPKSWVRTQTTTTSEHDGRKIRNITETLTTLESVGQNGLTLKLVSTVDVGGRGVETPPQKRTLDFYSEPIIEGTKIEQLPSTTLTIDKQLIPCEVRSYHVLLTPETRQRKTVWYSTQLHPHVLRVERILSTVPTERVPDERILSSSTTELLETDSLRLRRGRSGNYRYRTITKTGDITTDTVTSGSRLITGGLDNETIREFDRDGKVIRTTETRMINYYALTWASQRRN